MTNLENLYKPFLYNYPPAKNECLRTLILILFYYRTNQSTSRLYLHLNNVCTVKVKVSVQSDTFSTASFINKFPIDKINITSTRQRNAIFNLPNS